jgi:hypothetical protein
MSLISVEIRELREMHRQIVKGEIDLNTCSLRLKVYKATAERERMILDMHKLSTLKGMSMGKFSDSGLFSNREMLPGSFEAETILCPDMNCAVTREQCLDYSGEPKNNASCQSCQHYKETRNMLMRSRS